MALKKRKKKIHLVKNRLRFASKTRLGLRLEVEDRTLSLVPRGPGFHLQHCVGREEISLSDFLLS